MLGISGHAADTATAPRRAVAARSACAAGTAGTARTSGPRGRRGEPENCSSIDMKCPGVVDRPALGAAADPAGASALTGATVGRRAAASPGAGVGAFAARSGRDAAAAVSAQAAGTSGSGDRAASSCAAGPASGPVAASGPGRVEHGPADIEPAPVGVANRSALCHPACAAGAACPSETAGAAAAAYTAVTPGAARSPTAVASERSRASTPTLTRGGDNTALAAEPTVASRASLTAPTGKSRFL